MRRVLGAVPWAEIFVAVAVMIAGAGVFAYAHRAEGRLEESKVRGAAVVSALAAYREERGTYPERLDELVPQYLPRIPPPAWGSGDWSYDRYTPAEMTTAHDAATDVLYFRLSVAADEGGYPVLFYDITHSRWVLNN